MSNVERKVGQSPSPIPPMTTFDNIVWALFPVSTFFMIGMILWVLIVHNNSDASYETFCKNHGGTFEKYQSGYRTCVDKEGYGFIRMD